MGQVRGLDETACDELPHRAHRQTADQPDQQHVREEACHRRPNVARNRYHPSRITAPLCRSLRSSHRTDLRRRGPSALPATSLTSRPATAKVATLRSRVVADTTRAFGTTSTRSAPPPVRHHRTSAPPQFGATTHVAWPRSKYDRLRGVGGLRAGPAWANRRRSSGFSARSDSSPPKAKPSYLRVRACVDFWPRWRWPRVGHSAAEYLSDLLGSPRARCVPRFPPAGAAGRALRRHRRYGLSPHLWRRRRRLHRSARRDDATATASRCSMRRWRSGTGSARRIPPRALGRAEAARLEELRWSRPRIGPSCCSRGSGRGGGRTLGAHVARPPVPRSGTRAADPGARDRRPSSRHVARLSGLPTLLAEETGHRTVGVVRAIERRVAAGWAGEQSSAAISTLPSGRSVSC